MIDKRVDQIDDDHWKKLDDYFAELTKSHLDLEEQERIHLEGVEEGIEKGIKKGIGIGAAAIVQKFSEHLSTEQIANILDMSIDQVEAHLNNSEENT